VGVKEEEEKEEDGQPPGAVPYVFAVHLAIKSVFLYD